MIKNILFLFDSIKYKTVNKKFSLKLKEVLITCRILEGKDLSFLLLDVECYYNFKWCEKVLF